MDTFAQLHKHWQEKHFKHLLYCLQYCTAYFEDHFEYQGMRKGGVMIDGAFYTQEKIITLLANYYDDPQAFYTLPVYFAIFLAMCYMGLMMLNSLWIFIRFLFVRAEAYDLENEPSFRM